jgi:hypothetical protein
MLLRFCFSSSGAASVDAVAILSYAGTVIMQQLAEKGPLTITTNSLIEITPKIRLDTKNRQFMKTIEQSTTIIVCAMIIMQALQQCAGAPGSCVCSCAARGMQAPTPTHHPPRLAIGPIQ